MVIESFEFRNNTVIVSNGEVTAMDVRSFLQGKVRKKVFPRETQFRIYAGSHGDVKGNIDLDDYEIFKQLKAVVNFVHKKEKKSIDEMKYRGLLGSEIKHISSGQDCAECDFKPMVREFFEELVDSGKPYVLFMAFCYTDRNVLTRYMLASARSVSVSTIALLIKPASISARRARLSASGVSTRLARGFSATVTVEQAADRPRVSRNIGNDRMVMTFSRLSRRSLR